MVVCTGGFVAQTVASIMMNGLCCIWQMEAENDAREAIRKDIRVEYERQRKIEQEIWEQRQKQCQTENWYSGSASSVSTDDRRRKLIADKMNLLSVRSQGSSNSSSSRRRSQQAREGEEPREGPVLVQRVSSPLSRQPIKKRKVRIASPHSVVADFITTTNAVKPPQQWNDMSSLMDSAFDDDNEAYEEDIQDGNDGMPTEDEISSLVDVPLR
mmetsp:Transcript_13007/g.26388  ORF Transcript_13007/g.26388 Transcript_13007/m.26388 type:complete len:213 (-) Transcript_13007:137-775(-)